MQSESEDEIREDIYEDEIIGGDTLKDSMEAFEESKGDINAPVISS